MIDSEDYHESLHESCRKTKEKNKRGDNTRASHE